MILRLLALIAHCLYGLLLCISFRYMSDAKKQRLILGWHQSVLKIFRMRIVVKGLETSTNLSGPRLIVANHISWLDIHVLASQAPFTFVAKSDVMSWPVFGRFAKSVGTIFLNRNKSSDIKRVLRQMTSAFTNTEAVCIFPEGTSSDGKTILPFKSNLFEAVVDTQIPVTPTLISYQIDGKFTDIPAYYGDMTLIDSILSMLNTPGITAVIEIFPNLPLQESRQAYSRLCYKTLEQSLLKATPD